MAVDTLFEIFCECAELNPEPVEGEQYNPTVFPLTLYITLKKTLKIYNACAVASAENGEENEWFFGEQMQDNTNAG